MRAFRSLPAERVPERDIQDIAADEVAEGAGRIILLASFDLDVHLQILNPLDIEAALMAARDAVTGGADRPTTLEAILAASTAADRGSYH